MHILDQVQNIYIEPCQPVQHDIEFMNDFVIVQILGRDPGDLRTALHSVLLIKPAVNRVQKALCKICARSEELHFLAGLRCRDTAANTVVISPDRFHDVIILILDRAGVDGYLHRAVLCLDRGKIAEIQPLYRFLDI